MHYGLRTPLWTTTITDLQCVGKNGNVFSFFLEKAFKRVTGEKHKDLATCYIDTKPIYTLCQIHPHWDWNSKLNTKLRLEFQIEYGLKLEFQAE